VSTPQEPTEPGRPGWDPPAGSGPPPGYGPPAGYGPQPGYGPPGYGPPGYGGYGPGGQQTEGKAITALVLAIASFLLCPLIPAVVALFLAGAARRDIDASGGRLTGEGLITATRVLSWVNIALSVVAVALVVLAVAIGLMSTDPKLF